MFENRPGHVNGQSMEEEPMVETANQAEDVVIRDRRDAIRGAASNLVEEVARGRVETIPRFVVAAGEVPVVANVRRTNRVVLHPAQDDR